jgi:hypothetical protein
VTVVGSVVHVMLIEGTMALVSKPAVRALVLAAAMMVMADRRPDLQKAATPVFSRRQEFDCS